MKEFKLYPTGANLLDIKRDALHGKYANVPNTFILEETNLEEYFSPEIIAQIHTLPADISFNLAYEVWHPLRLYLMWSDPISNLKLKISNNKIGITKLKNQNKVHIKSINKYNKIQNRIDRKLKSNEEANKKVHPAQ